MNPVEKVLHGDSSYEICVCGRLVDPQHCVYCGSTFVYGRSTRNKKIQAWNPIENHVETTIIRNFMCRRCNREFFEDEPCEAKPALKKERLRVAGLDRSGRSQGLMSQNIAESPLSKLNFIEQFAKATGRAIDFDVVKQSLGLTPQEASQEASQEQEQEESEDETPLSGALRAANSGEYTDDIFSLDLDQDSNKNKKEVTKTNETRIESTKSTNTTNKSGKNEPH